MQPLLGAVQAALLLAVFSVSLFTPAAAFADASVRRNRQHDSFLLSRTRKQAPTTAAPGQTAAVTTTDIGKANVREAADIAWKAAGEASEARAATSALRSKINRLGADAHGDRAIQAANSGGVYAPAALGAEAAAQSSLKQALAAEAEVKKIVQTVDEHAYKAAKATAVKEIAKLEAEGKEYYKSLLEKFEALAEPPPPTAADAAAKAATPYNDVVLRVQAIVQYYNEKAITTIAQAQQTVFTAQNIARTAQMEQTAGIVDMAQRHMMQAHMLIGAANLKKQEAYKIRKLAESLNMSIPNYQQAALQAVNHALATFSGLQMSDKAHAEMQRKIEDSTRKIDDALKALDTALAAAVKLTNADIK